ncbi:hypothetical protein [Ferruginibacter sp. SUN106]|uniref:hypothetical protein n=1 Tax=Ferruginibacter sp. SUN106 TaxID=2978348 RepID=UPI003D36A785
MLFVNGNNAIAQTIAYSKGGNMYINNPDYFQLVANIAGNHHLLSFSHNEKPEISIYNAKLEFVQKTNMPFTFPDNAELRIVPFDSFYYVFIRPHFTKQYLFWKVDGNGNCTDMSDAFQKLLQSQSDNIKLGFQLIPNQGQLWMLYHTAIDDVEKSTLVMLQADSLLNVSFIHKVSYDFKRYEEKLQQEILIFGRYLFVLKTLESGTSLELMKVNLATGFTIRNNFHSSGYLYAQPYVDFNTTDSTVTVSALLIDPDLNYRAKQFVFVSRLNKILVEQAPFAILKSQFRKKANTNFILVDGGSKWMNFAKWQQRSPAAFNDDRITVYKDYTMSATANQDLYDIDNQLTKITQGNNVSYSDEMGVRFSLLNKDFKIISDSLMPNNKDRYTIFPGQFTRFKVDSREYLMVAHQFFNRKKGLLLVTSNDTQGLGYNYLRVNERYNYMLSKSRVIPEQGIIMPYLYKREAGLIKIGIK